MKKICGFLSLTALLLFLLPSVASADLGLTSPNDSAVGSNKVTQPSGDYQHVTLSAHSGPAGEDPKGHVQAKFQSGFFPGGEGHVIGDVMCLSVSGNQARIAALLKEPHEGNTHITLIVFDNGNPSSDPPPDFVFIGFTSSPPADCANFGTTLLGESSGNVQVHDAS